MKIPMYFLLILFFFSCTRESCENLPQSFSSYELAEKSIRKAEFKMEETQSNFKSSWINRIEFYSCDGEFGFLIIKIKNKSYFFEGVPVNLCEEFKQAESKGKFYHRHIKGKFTFKLNS
ncbi:MAG: KTSC domain-containing protein [Flavobacteriaceae bacterium]|jgi:hypothetical protein|nr:KTSC domain-containing protein [Flavobacteriaceae bacterium]